MGGKLRIYLLAIFAGIGGWLFGFDTGTIGSITIMPQFSSHFQPSHHNSLASSESSPESPLPLSPLLRGFIVSSILIPASLIGILAGPISDKLSRTHTISLGAGIFSLGSAICSAAPSGKAGLGVLIFGRCIAGSGEGLFLSTVLVWTQEISNLSDRGRLSAIQQVTINLGICAGFFTCYGTHAISSSLSWRIPFALQSLSSLILCIGSPILLPHTPNWLRMQGYMEEARKVLDMLHKTMREQEKEEILLGCGDVVIAGDAVANRKAGAGWRQLFTKGNKGRTLFAMYLLASSQLSGIDAVLFYAPTLFTQAGLSAGSASYIASGITGLVLLTTALLFQPLMDSARFGRRPVTLVGGCGLSVCLLVIGSLYASGAAHNKAGKWVIVALIELFVIFFVATWSMTLRPYASEIARPRTRAAVSSLAWATNQAVNFVLTLTTPYFLAASSSGPYFLYSGTTALAVLISLVLMVETANRTVDCINEAWVERTSAEFWKKRLEGFGKGFETFFKVHHDQPAGTSKSFFGIFTRKVVGAGEGGGEIEMDSFARLGSRQTSNNLDEEVVRANGDIGDIELANNNNGNSSDIDIETPPSPFESAGRTDHFDGVINNDSIQNRNELEEDTKPVQNETIVEKCQPPSIATIGFDPSEEIQVIERIYWQYDAPVITPHSSEDLPTALSS